ncbi:hypothetical protein GQ55_2G410100 [Panicum hallii var. hallii]|uniref:Uncharacterized protein n=1 Tax=Panicum hallii var. hallii TaxID=1504633 RepID=A0A2T7EXU1_9POAL|nr:hypothetical protein GQ55_2G410100 [Panicum hallii var. hallii]
MICSSLRPEAARPSGSWSPCAASRGRRPRWRQRWRAAQPGGGLGGRPCTPPHSPAGPPPCLPPGRKFCFQYMY